MPEPLKEIQKAKSVKQALKLLKDERLIPELLEAS
jgi:hypothetical protein